MDNVHGRPNWLYSFRKKADFVVLEQSAFDVKPNELKILKFGAAFLKVKNVPLSTNSRIKVHTYVSNVKTHCAFDNEPLFGILLRTNRIC